MRRVASVFQGRMVPASLFAGRLPRSLKDFQGPRIPKSKNNKDDIRARFLAMAHLLLIPSWTSKQAKCRTDAGRKSRKKECVSPFLRDIS